MVKRSKIIAEQPKTIKNPNIIDIKSVTIEEPKPSCKLSKTIRQAEKISQVSGAGKYPTSPLNIKTTKSEFFLWNKHYEKCRNDATISCI